MGEVSKECEAEAKREIFVSYAREDRGWIDALGLDRNRVGTEQACFWTDRSGITAGDPWPQVARDALARASAAVLLISKNFLASHAIEKYELPGIIERYRKGEMAVVLVPIGKLEVAKVGKKLRRTHLHNIVSIPGWSTPLPTVPEPRPQIRDEIVSAATESREVQQLRRSLNPNYQLNRSLGSGTLGRVFSAWDSQLKREVSIKLVDRDEMDRDFENSVRKVASATDASNILTFYAAYLDVQPPHYIRQYVDGRSLRQYMSENRSRGRSPAFVQEFLTTIGSAVRHAHREGIVDLNIKPTSIMVVHDAAGARRNFSISLSSYREEQLVERADYRDHDASIFYLPPEYRKGRRDDRDGRIADQYRLGLTAYELLVGPKRFERLAKPLRSRDFDVDTWRWPELVNERSDCPDHLLRVISRMVQTQPKDRHGSLDAALQQIAAELSVEIARDSYRRIVATEERQRAFFKAFYVALLRAYGGIKEVFFGELGPLEVNDPPSEAWLRQFQKLKEAILLLLAFRGLNEKEQEPNILTRIAEGHTRRGIPGALYEGFHDVLLESLCSADEPPAFLGVERLREAWIDVLRPGIDYMVEKERSLQLARFRSDAPYASPLESSANSCSAHRGRK